MLFLHMPNGIDILVISSYVSPIGGIENSCLVSASAFSCPASALAHNSHFLSLHVAATANFKFKSQIVRGGNFGGNAHIVHESNFGGDSILTSPENCPRKHSHTSQCS